MKTIFSIAAICLLTIGCAPSRTAVSVQYTDENSAVSDNKSIPKKFEAFQQSKPIPRNSNEIRNMNPHPIM